MRLTTGEQLREMAKLLPRYEVTTENADVFRARIAELEAELAALKAKAAVPDRVAMAKALCNYHADLCGVSRDDQWFIFSDDFLNDVDVMLAAAPAQPQSDQDYIHLCAALYQACGAYDMPERVLDALSAAANAQPFIHLVDGILPCMPDQPQSDGVLMPVSDVEEYISLLIDEADAHLHGRHQPEIQAHMRAEIERVRALLGGEA